MGHTRLNPGCLMAVSDVHLCEGCWKSLAVAALTKRCAEFCGQRIEFVFTPYALEKIFEKIVMQKNLLASAEKLIS